MSKIKIIDLLNKIANVEEVPKKIKYENKILYYDDEDNDGNNYNATFNYYDEKGYDALINGWIGQYINDEIEIIEESNKIEKLNIELNKFDENKVNCYRATNLECDIALKINEIIDYINNGEKNE